MNLQEIRNQISAIPSLIKQAVGGNQEAKEVKNINTQPEIVQKIQSQFPVPKEYEQHIDEATSSYPDIPPAMIKTILAMESVMGKNDKNKKLDAGEYGWLGGITKGTFQDMIDNEKKGIEYKVFKLLGDEARNISTPRGAIGVIASIAEQKRRNNNFTIEDVNKALEFYDKYYKTQLGAKMTKEMKEKFIRLYKEYESD